jgi:nuclear protein localization family protein 4
MVEASLVLPTTEHAMLKRIEEQDEVLSDSTYIPEVFYRYKNDNGVEVQQAAYPTFPVDYMIVSLTHGFPSNPGPLFHSLQQNVATFPAPHRTELDQRPSIQTLGNLLFGQEYSLELFCDFNLLLFLAKCGFLHQTDLLLLCTASVEGTGHYSRNFRPLPHGFIWHLYWKMILGKIQWI